MGAYGHSKFREFVLGGVTRTMLSRPPVPVFLSIEVFARRRWFFACDAWRFGHGAMKC